MGNRVAWLVLAAIACNRTAPDQPDATSSSSGDEPTTILPSESIGDTSAGPQSSSETSPTTGGADESSSSDTGTAPVDCEAFDTFVPALSQARDDAQRMALVEAFVADAQYSAHGLPLRCDGRLIALAWDPDASSLALTGDFSDWDPDAHPMQRPVEGFPLFVADVAVAEPLAPSLYKLVRDGDTFVADPWARRFGWDELGEYSLTDARADVGHHERWPDFADGVGALQPRDVVVYLPVGAEAGDPLAVLYMHDGQNLFAPDAFFGGWRVAAAIDDAIASGVLPPTIVVGIANTDARFEEYTHTVDDIGSGPIGGRADEYADFVVFGIKPFVDARYPTRPEREATAVLGSSLGGLVSLYFGARHPDVFAAVGSMSGTLGWGAADEQIAARYEAMPPDDLWVYLDSGGEGPCPGGADNFCVTIDMRDRLAALGWAEPETLVYVHAQGANHDEAAWAARLPGFLTALGDRLGGL